MPLPPHLPNLLAKDDGSLVTSAIEWDLKRSSIKDNILGIVGKPPVERVAMESMTHSTTRCDRYQRIKVSYLAEEDERVSAWLLIPHEPSVLKAAVLCFHQTVACGKNEPVGIDGSASFQYAHELACYGYVTLSPDHICAGERVAEGFEAFDTEPFYQRHPEWSAVGKAIWDGMRALDYLETLTDDVDPSRIGCIGHSLGGHSTLFLAAFDDRVQAAVSSCGLTTFLDDENRMNWARDHWYRYMPRLRTYFEKGASPPFDFHDVAALVAPRAFLNTSALNDVCYSDTEGLADMGIQLHRLYRLLDAPGGFANYLHGQGHGFPGEARALAYGWLDRWLNGEDSLQPT